MPPFSGTSRPYLISRDGAAVPEESLGVGVNKERLDEGDDVDAPGKLDPPVNCYITMENNYV